MASIERTAYPRFKRFLTEKELSQVYTPTFEEIQFVYNIARGPMQLLNAMILLKTSQRLGYFPKLEDVPSAVVDHIRNKLNLSPNVSPGYEKPRTRYEHQAQIRAFRKIIAYGKEAQRIAMETVYKAAEVMDHPADLINVAIAELINRCYELPAFSTLDRLAGHIRTLVNNQFFQQVMDRLTSQEIERLDGLLERGIDQHYSDYNRLKQLPKQARLSEIKEQLDHLAWLYSFGDIGDYLDIIPPAKVKNFSAQANALDAQEIKDFSPAKRYTLLLCLIYRVQLNTRDNLATLLIKRMGNLHNAGKEELERVRVQHREKTENLVSAFTEILRTLQEDPQDAEVGRLVKETLASRGSIRTLLDDCEAVASYNGNNYLPLILKFFRSHRSVLFRLVESLELSSTSQDSRLMKALDFIMEHRNRRSDWLPDEVDISFASGEWQRIIRIRKRMGWEIARRHLEVCVFSYLANELKSGDICVKGSDAYADYREYLLSWEECEPMLAEYCNEMGFPGDVQGFVNQLKDWMSKTCHSVDEAYPDCEQIVEINEEGEPVLKRLKRQESSPSIKHLETLIQDRLPERNIIDILCNVEHWINWTRHFGPLSGSDPKLENAKERYILNTFAYGCNLGPAQAARHMRGLVTPRTLSFVNQRHFTAKKLDEAIKDIINHYYRFDLPQLWGSGKSAAADGTKYDIYEDNLLAEYHIRYGGYGGIAYHHVADNYIALFSHFIPCGVWEAIYIIEGLLKNKSDIQPDTIHADTQGQSTPVFVLAYLLGVKLMPRIRNLKRLRFYRPSKDVTYNHIDRLFSHSISWQLIETHWQDLIRVVLSIKAGKISSALLLRKLGNYSRKNRLYQAFRELGRVVRTVFLLQYISDMELRQQITATTNKVEAYNGFAKWLFFGGEGIIADNDPNEQEKAIKYNDLIANAVIFQNVVDLTSILRELSQEDYELNSEDVAALSPYITSHIKRFGDYVIDLNTVPQPLDERLELA